MNSERLEILHCGGGWPTNIGNAFIDYGIKYILSNIFSNSKYHFTSNATDWVYNNYGNSIERKNFLNLSSIIKSDYCVFGGSMLSELWFREHGKIFDSLIKNKTKIIMLGVSGPDSYTEKERDKVREILKKLDVFILISRDRKAFEYYGDLAENSYDGIDCAFYLNNTFKPAKLNLAEYVTFNFDKMRPPFIKTEKKIVRSHHEAWKFASNNPFSLWDIKLFVWNILHHQINLIAKNDFLSDLPEDYLNLYANSNETYSDRIHACVATLSFGNCARLYSKSARSLLFDRVGLSEITTKLVQLDKQYINLEKENELKILSKFVG